jgi:hypothetical protein
MQYLLDSEAYFTMIYLIDWFTHRTKTYSSYCFTLYPKGLFILQNFPLTLAVQQNNFNILIQGPAEIPDDLVTQL